MILIPVSIGGVLLFLWPLWGASAPGATAAGVVCLAALLCVATTELTLRRLDSRRLALLIVIAALDTALRAILVTGLFGFSPIFFLILCAGYIYGPTYGFLCGSVTMVVSGLATGGIGPWLPYEMFGLGWVGALAGCFSPRTARPITTRDLILLATIGAIVGWLYGAALDLWDWTFFYRNAPDFGWVPGLGLATLLQRFGHFYLVTSLAWDTARSIGNVLLVVLLGKPILLMLQRLKARLTFVVVPVTPASTAPRASPSGQNRDVA